MTSFPSLNPVHEVIGFTDATDHRRQGEGNLPGGLLLQLDLGDG